MEKILVVLALLAGRTFSAGSLSSTLTHCCDIGKSWYSDHKSCNITLLFNYSEVAFEHSTMCLNTVGACCLHSLREQRCNEGKQVGLDNGICNDSIQQAKNQLDFMMCCEICKIGVVVGSTNAVCQPTPFSHSEQWDEVYQSCCSAANTKTVSKPPPLEPIKNNRFKTAKNYCTDGAHNCTPREYCVNTPTGFECRFRQLPLPMSNTLENLTKPKHNQNCQDGFTYSVYEQRCKDIDECVQRPCDVNELCENTIGSFKCHCKNGFQLDQVTNACTDVNECQLNLHSCHESQRCDNTIGSYQCVRFTGCGTGYTLDVESAICLDDDECALKTDNCAAMGPDLVCRNTLGSFRCEKKRCVGPRCRVSGGGNQAIVAPSPAKCLRGYEKDHNNKCSDINECRLPNLCMPNQVCVNTNGSYYCLTKWNNATP